MDDSEIHSEKDFPDKVISSFLGGSVLTVSEQLDYCATQLYNLVKSLDDCLSSEDKQRFDDIFQDIFHFKHEVIQIWHIYYHLTIHGHPPGVTYSSKTDLYKLLVDGLTGLKESPSRKLIKAHIKKPDQTIIFDDQTYLCRLLVDHLISWLNYTVQNRQIVISPNEVRNEVRIDINVEESHKLKDKIEMRYQRMGMFHQNAVESLLKGLDGSYDWPPNSTDLHQRTNFSLSFPLKELTE